jgi:hypothetical protein
MGPGTRNLKAGYTVLERDNKVIRSELEISAFDAYQIHPDLKIVEPKITQSVRYGASHYAGRKVHSRYSDPAK